MTFFICYDPEMLDFLSGLLEGISLYFKPRECQGEN